MDNKISYNSCYLFAVFETLDEGASSSPDFLEEDSILVPSGIDCSIPDPLGNQGRFCGCFDEQSF